MKLEITKCVLILFRNRQFYHFKSTKRLGFDLGHSSFGIIFVLRSNPDVHKSVEHCKQEKKSFKMKE